MRVLAALANFTGVNFICVNLQVLTLYVLKDWGFDNMAAIFPNMTAIF